MANLSGSKGHHRNYGSASHTPRILNNKAGAGKGMISAGMDNELARGNEDLINFLEQKLEQMERNLIVKQQEYDLLNQDHRNLQA